MAVVEDGDGGLVLRVVERALGLVPLHHRHRLRPEGGAEALQLADQMRHVPAGAGEHQRLQRLQVGQRILDGEPAAPAMAEQMDLAEAERLPHRLDLLDIAADGPQRLVLGLVGVAGAELVVGDDPIALARPCAAAGRADSCRAAPARRSAGTAPRRRRHSCRSPPCGGRSSPCACRPCASSPCSPPPACASCGPFHLTQRRPAIAILAAR